MTNMQEWLTEHLTKLNLVDEMNYDTGFTRLSYSEEEKQAHETFRHIALSLGLEVHQDEAGNQWATWKVDDKVPTVAVGSHVDTVRSGGGYDGVAGVLAGLASIKLLKDRDFIPSKNITVICFASEESARFGVSTIGSKALTGLLEDNLAEVKDSDGVSVREALESYGLTWENLPNAELRADELESFLELHIEQGTQIEDHGADIGVVRGVACPIRLQVTFSGMANHTGTTPMDKRSDAFVASAPLIPFVEEEAKKMNEDAPLPLVATVSTVQLSPNVMNVIPGEVTLGIDIRSVEDELKIELAKRIKSFCEEIERERSVTVTIKTLVDNDSVFLDPNIQETLANVAKQLDYKPLAMDSGAGHDVMNMATRWPSGLIFIPCQEGISHHPKEYASIEDLEKGTRMIAEYLRIETGDEHENNNWRNRTA
ncbi:M20 family metallo-hydrolase [Pontibacillus marinus]|nr:M20 family metallo-hydrolase [Pontibacillus marinus]